MPGFYRYDQNLDKYVPMPVELLASEGEEYTAPKITQKFNEVETKTTEILNKVLTDDRYFTVTSSFKQDATLDIEYFVTRVTPKTAEAKKSMVQKTFAYDFEKNVDPTSSYFGTTNRETVLSMAKRKRSVVAINASGWRSSGEVMGLQIKDGVLYKDYDAAGYTGAEACVFFDDGTMKVYGNREVDADILISKGARNSFAFGIWLVKDSKPRTSQMTTWADLNVKHPRQAIGQRSDGTLVIITVDGRSLRSSGITAYDMPSLFLSEGCVNAFLLDGGGSSQTVVEGKYINNISDGIERAVVDTLTISYPNDDKDSRFFELQEGRGLATSLNRRVEFVESKPTWNVLDLGFSPDGLIDNTAKFKKALSDLSEKGGGKLHFPKGTYLIGKQSTTSASEKIELPPNISIVGERRSYTKLLRNPNHSLDELLRITDHNYIEGIEIDGNSSVNKSSCRLITGGNIKSFKMKDCSLVNATDRGVSISGIGKSITIEGMYISNIANECINVAGGEIIKLIDSEITFSGTALWVGNAANIFTKNNLAKSLKTFVRYKNSQNAICSGNIITNNIDRAIWGSVREAVFSDNVFKQCHSDYHLYFIPEDTGTNDLIVTGNSVYSEVEGTAFIRTPSDIDRKRVSGNVGNIPKLNLD
ncbi:phosphodiester glycosidase family protein [Bacillus sp. SB47]|uniref:phosphodiester glycosidase family protein n=1 Tax=Bacillus sp. SB47 TaxID=1071079 RepID=UPI000414CB9F|nr:phosphodiester glycosidase family protein [Bacillus sp. SB47]